MSTLSASMITGGAEQATIVGQGGRHEAVRVAELGSAPGGVEQRLAECGFPVWRWAVPSPMARSIPRTGSGSAACA